MNTAGEQSKCKNVPQNADQVEREKAERRSEKDKRVLRESQECDVTVLFQDTTRAVYAETASKRILTTSFPGGEINEDVRNATSGILQYRREIFLG